jgi:DNA polymerase III subunit delta'
MLILMDFFKGIIGHAGAKEALACALRRPHHGYLIEGAPGAGAHALAEAFVRALVDYSGDRPLTGHPDIAVLRREWNDAGTALKKEIAVREVRALRMRVAERPVIAGRVVAYIPDADYLNEEGVNALLKSVEEPPADAVFVLVAHQSGRLPATLKSRVQSLRLRRVETGEIRAWLVSLGIPEVSAERCATLAAGRPGVARRLAEDEAYAARVADADRTIADLLCARSLGDAFAAVSNEAAQCESADDPVTEWRETLHLWGAALSRRLADAPSASAAGIGHAFLAAERGLGGPISPRILLELGLNQAVSGKPDFPGWVREEFRF